MMGIKSTSDGQNLFTGVVGNKSPKLKEQLLEKTNEIRAAIPNTYFCSDESIASGAQGYDSGAVYFKQYSLDTLPSGDVLIKDLQAMLEIYSAYYLHFYSEVWHPSKKEYNPEITKDQWLETLRDGQTFTENAFIAIAALYDIGGSASCRE